MATLNNAVVEKSHDLKGDTVVLKNRITYTTILAAIIISICTQSSANQAEDCYYSMNAIEKHFEKDEQRSSKYVRGKLGYMAMTNAELSTYLTRKDDRYSFKEALSNISACKDYGLSIGEMKMLVNIAQLQADKLQDDYHKCVANVWLIGSMLEKHLGGNANDLGYKKSYTLGVQLGEIRSTLNYVFSNVDVSEETTHIHYKKLASSYNNNTEKDEFNIMLSNGFDSCNIFGMDLSEEYDLIKKYL